MKVVQATLNIFKEKKDLAVAGIIFLYCFLFAVLRISVSSTMELDEAEQFLNASFFSFGYALQPPLYSWLAYGMSLLFGMNIYTLIILKYLIMVVFYFSFYLIAKSFWNTGVSLLITGTLLLFPTYTYEFNRDLSHSVLVTTMASITCYLFVRLLSREEIKTYLFFGASIGLGFLSKYNFVFFLLPLSIAGISFREGRRVLFNKRIVLSFVSCIIIILPHIIWLIKNDYLPFSHALTKADAGALEWTAAGIIHIVVTSYSGVLVSFVVFLIFFGFSFLYNSAHRCTLHLPLFRHLCFYGLAFPLVVMAVLRTGHFSERWLAPLLFTLPLAVFSALDISLNSHKFKLYFFSISGISDFLTNSSKTLS